MDSLSKSSPQFASSLRARIGQWLKTNFFIATASLTRNMSAVWKFFSLETPRSRTARCDVCKAGVPRGGSCAATFNTTNLIRHLRTHHGKEHEDFLAMGLKDQRKRQEPLLEAIFKQERDQLSLNQMVEEPEQPPVAAAERSSNPVGRPRGKRMNLHEKLAVEFHERKLQYLKEEHELKMRILEVELSIKEMEREEKQQQQQVSVLCNGVPVNVVTL